MDVSEIAALTKAMISAGDRISWRETPILDKHCVGGLPGNRTTPIVVAIAAASGLIMPKTSSRAITSPAGTADTMETIAPVNLSLAAMRRVVEQEGGCIVWGGAVRLSPADDLLIRIERALDIDGEGQLVASVLSKKIAAGSTHAVIDVPVGPTAKVRSKAAADDLAGLFRKVAGRFGLNIEVVVTDGLQPVGRGIGPALEARDVLSVLCNKEDAPSDLRKRSVGISGALLELGGVAPEGGGYAAARRVLESGAANDKFVAICEAQGGMREPPRSSHTHPVPAGKSGQVSTIDNRRLARIAKLAGAPRAKAAGVEIHVRLGETVSPQDPVYTVHAETRGELDYALDFVVSMQAVVGIDGK
jgi:thymidine phosphorylase